MKQSREAMLTDHMDGFKEETVDYSKFEISFRRWVVGQIDGGHMTIQEVRDKFHLSRKHYTDILKRWQERYSDDLHISLSFMDSKERAENKKLEARIIELEKQLEYAKMKDVAMNTLIDVAEKELKISIRKKSGSKQ